MKTYGKFIKSHISPNIFLGICCGIAVVLCLTLFFSLRSSTDFNIQTELENLTKSVRQYYQKSPDYRGLDTSFAVQNKIIPLSMVRHQKIYSFSKSEILIGKDTTGQTLLPMDRSFGVTYLRLNKKDCLKIAETHFDQTSGLVEITVQNEKAYTFTYGGELALPFSQDDAIHYCGHQNTVTFTFE